MWYVLTYVIVPVCNFDNLLPWNIVSLDTRFVMGWRKINRKRNYQIIWSTVDRLKILI